MTSDNKPQPQWSKITTTLEKTPSGWSDSWMRMETRAQSIRSYSILPIGLTPISQCTFVHRSSETATLRFQSTSKFLTLWLIDHPVSSSVQAWNNLFLTEPALLTQRGMRKENCQSTRKITIPLWSAVKLSCRVTLRADQSHIATRHRSLMDTCNDSVNKLIISSFSLNRTSSTRTRSFASMTCMASRAQEMV